MAKSTVGMRALPNIVGLVLILFGCASLLSGLGYIGESRSVLSVVFESLASLAGAVILISSNRARLRLRRMKGPSVNSDIANRS